MPAHLPISIISAVQWIAETATTAAKAMGALMKSVH
jgi:hypothetical protein